MQFTKMVKTGFRSLPLWTVRVLVSGWYLFRSATGRNRYPLADHANSLSCQPLLMVSAGRSGTTLLRSMLVASEQIAIPPESQVIPKAVRRFISLQYLGWEDLCRLIVALFEGHEHFHLWDVNLQPVYRAVIELPEKERSLARIIDEIFKGYVARQCPGITVWGDQSTINTLYLSWVFSTFPQAKYLHVLRDGRDAIASMMGTGRQTMQEATDRWIISVRNVLSLQEQLDADQFLEVRYEDLVQEAPASLKRLCSFIGIEYTAQMLDYWKLPTTIEHKHFAFHQNLGKPVFTSSIGKWAERLSPEQQDYILPRISGLLEAFGYLG